METTAPGVEPVVIALCLTWRGNMSDRTLKETLHIVGIQGVSADYLISEGHWEAGGMQ